MARYIDIHTHYRPASANGGENVEIGNFYSGFEQAGHGQYCSMGLHPWYLDGYEAALEELKKYSALPNVLAIGECGLDKVCNTPWPVQAAALKQQVKLANKLGKPLMIHCVRAFDELIHLLDTCAPEVPVIIHGYNKKGAVAGQLLEQGYYLSFGQAILNDSFPAGGVLKGIDAGRFFLETDDGAAGIEEIYDKAAAIRGTTVAAIQEQQEQNFNRVFKIQVI